MSTIQALQSNSKLITEKWLLLQASEEGDFADAQTEEQKAEAAELVTSLVKSLTENSIDDPDSDAFSKVKENVGILSLSRARQGYSPRETATFILRLKEAMLEVLSSEITDAKQLYADSLKISKILDNIMINSFESFIKGREDIIMRQTDEITEISTPVIRVWDGVLALPIIGTLDSSRTQVVMESLLQQIVESESSIAILDISGVPAVDTLVAQHLIKTVSATRLMGAECIISGIRPEIAQTIVHLGIDLSGIITKATLASALRTSFDMLRYDVVKKSERKLATGA
ncbi:STAS domain-containing protein [Flavobacterium selenitireducens]|uniref:STAS domain-containing protein n=1 Tax=Flavobacterium selenitireducens TaxID=2722704 RepID=UPI00168A4D62|nr:STAS domain-containing protein [Flavobacterium selenitireducens]MBD3581873.1 STAS domain-containing protein [Flavobacterium selenitireducens]